MLGSVLYQQFEDPLELTDQHLHQLNDDMTKQSRSGKAASRTMAVSRTGERHRITKIVVCRSVMTRMFLFVLKCSQKHRAASDRLLNSFMC